MQWGNLQSPTEEAWKSASEAQLELMIFLSKSELYSMRILAILKLRTTAHL